jgi:FkbM family methyltransferase
MVQSLTTLARRALRRVKRHLRPPLHRPDRSVAYVFLGSEYGGWPVLKDSLTPDSCVYCFGIGDDISFDLALIERFGCGVKAFDPTPRSVRWVQRAGPPDRFRFFPVGLSDKTRTLRFSAPPKAAHVSYTTGARDSETDIVELPVKALDEILADTGDGGKTIDLLKMDIEGSEYDAVPDMIAKGILPRQLCIEFHHGMFGYSNGQTRGVVDALRAAGYTLYFVSDAGQEYGFFR